MPAQLFDCKAAIRWIKGNAERFGFDKNKIAVQGVLAGGHLALMLGLRNESKLEGDVGNYLSEDSKISCIVSGFSPSNLEELGGEEVESLWGEKLTAFQKANEASPINWISKENELPIYLYQAMLKKSTYGSNRSFYNLTKKSKFKDVYYQKIIMVVKKSSKGFKNK